MARTGSFLIYFVLILFSVTSQAGVVVQAQVDRQRVNVGETLTYVISVITSDDVQISDPQIPSLQNFEMLQSWRSSEAQSSFTSQGYVSQQTEKFNFQLVPRQEGRIVIGSSTVNVDGKSYKTQPIVLEVYGPKSGQRAPPPTRNRQQQADPFGTSGDMDDAFNALIQDMMKGRSLPQPGDTSQNGEIPQGPSLRDMTYDNKGDPDFFIAVSVAKKTAFVNEPIMVSYYLYAKGQVVDLDTLQYPNLKGFWKEDIEVATALNFAPEIINGVRYSRALLVSYALFPIKPGTLQIDPYKARVSVIANPFGFGGKSTQVRQSPVATIEVRNLPLPPPASFTGGVGQFGVSFQPETSQPVQGQPFVVRARIEGLGNAKLIQNPNVSWPEGVEVYDTKSTAQYFKDGRSFKEVEYFLVNKNEGVTDFAPLKFSYFDYKKNQYIEAATNGFSLKFLKGLPQNQLAQSQMKKNMKAKAEAEDPTPKPLTVSHGSLFSIPEIAQWLMVLASFIVFLILIFRKFAVELGWGAQKKTIESQVKRRFKRIEEMVVAKNLRQTGSQLFNLLNFVLGEVTGQGGASEETAKLLEKMPPSVRREMSEKILKASEQYQTLSFAPDEMVQGYKTSESLQGLLNDSKEFIQKVLELSFSHKEE